MIAIPQGHFRVGSEVDQQGAGALFVMREEVRGGMTLMAAAVPPSVSALQEAVSLGRQSMVSVQ